MVNATQLLNNIYNMYNKYQQSPQTTQKTNLKFVKDDLVMIIQQNKNKNSIFGKMAKAGKPVEQVMIKPLPSMTDYQYFGVYMNKRLYIYDDALVKFFKIDWSDLFKYLAKQNIEARLYTDSNYQIEAGLDKDTGRYAFYVITNLSTNKTMYLLSADIFAAYMNTRN